MENKTQAKTNIVTTEQEATEFTTALNKLTKLHNEKIEDYKTLLNGQRLPPEQRASYIRLFGEFNKTLHHFILHVQELKNQGKPIVSLTKALNATYLRLTGNLKSDDYDNVAVTMQGSTSIGMQILGSLMVAFSMAIMGVTVLCSAALLSPTLGIATMVVGYTATVGTAVAGFSIFQRKGLAHAMSEVDRLDKAMNQDDDLQDDIWDWPDDDEVGGLNFD